MTITESSEEVKVLTKRCSICGWAMDNICPKCGGGNATFTNNTIKLPKSLLAKWFR